MAPYMDSTHTVSLGAYPFEQKEKLIQPGEIVRVQFAGMNEKVSAMLNMYGGVETAQSFEGSGQRGNNVRGQQVDSEGFLEFPLIGRVKAAGLSQQQLKAVLLKEVEPHLRDPLVYVELPYRGVTLLGEVKVPATVSFPKPGANLLELLAMVGYSTEFADLSKVKIYRELPDGQRILGHLDLNNPNFLNSEFFHPLPNDVVYIPASKTRATRTLALTIAPFAGLVFALLSLITIFIR